MPLVDSLGSPLPAAPKPPDSWEKAKTISSIASAVVIPLALLWVGNGYTTALKERELQGKFVELAVQILREDPDKQEDGLREWATQVITKFSGVEFSAETKKALIETTPLPSGPQRYEGRLGNTARGDGAKFVGRGYLQIVGRTAYAKYSQVLGVDLLDNPDKALEPKVAADILAIWFKERQVKYSEVLSKNDQASARRITTGGTGLVAQVAERYKVYSTALAAMPIESTKLSLTGITNPAWLSEHVPALLVALRNRGIVDHDLQAYALATAEVESSQGTRMKEVQ